MKCEQAEELISTLADNELSDPQRSSIEDHLKDCPRCQRAYEWHRSLNSEIRTVSASVVAPDDLRRRILIFQCREQADPALAAIPPSSFCFRSPYHPGYLCTFSHAATQPTHFSDGSADPGKD